MVSAGEPLHELALRQGQVKHAVKTALACCLATALSNYYHLPSSQLAVVFAYLLMTLGMPTPNLNWLLTQLAIAVSAIVSGHILVAFSTAPAPFLVVTLLWIFICLLFSSWFPLPATLGAMVSALGVFVFFEGTVGATLNFYFAYTFNFLIGGGSVVVVNTLLWPYTTQKVFLQRLAEVYARLESHCRLAARQLRSGESAPEYLSPYGEWAPFRPLRQLLAPELRRGRDTSNPFARMIIACRSLNLRLWFFNRAIAPVAPAALPAEARLQMANLLDQCAGHLHALLEGILDRKQVPPVDAALLAHAEPLPEAGRGGSVATAARSGEGPGEGLRILLAQGIHQSVLHRFIQGLQSVTTCQNALFANLRTGLAGQLVMLSPVAADTRLLNVQSLRSSTKLVVIILLLLAEEAWFRFQGGSQVAFYATFFASTGNLGKQNKTDLVGVAGLLAGFVYGVVAAFLTSRLPFVPLLLALVFLGQFLANLAFQRLPRYGVAGLQAGLALPFAYLATTGPQWGSFTTVETRFWGLVVAGCTAVVVHAYLWPVLPMHQLRASIAAALRDTAVSLANLFGASRAAWEGAPPSLAVTETRARDLLDDARYLPGPDHADPAYNGILGSLQEIDANLEFIQFIVNLEEEHPLRQRFFQVIGNYAEQARTNLEQVAQQFQPSPSRAALMEPIHWQPDASARWESVPHDVDPVPDSEIDPRRPAVIAHCLNQIARAVEQISSVAWEINLRNSGG